MDKVTIVNLLTNSGLEHIRIDDNFVYFDDPSCILTVFDKILNYAWLVILLLTAFMLFGWAVLYIKNGLKIASFFKNARSLILIFCIFGAVKPIVNFVYRDNLLSQKCDQKRVSLATVQELYESRKKQFGQDGQEMLYETFDVVDSGLVFTEGNTSAQNEQDAKDAAEHLLSAMGRVSSSSTSSANLRKGDQDNIDNDDTNFFSDDDVTINTASTSNNISATSGKNFVIYTDRNGQRIKRSSGSMAWRNNNPGNIINSDFARKHGAIGVSGKFAVFPDEQTGMNAVKSLLRSGGYNNLSIYAAIHKWAPAADSNDPKKYTEMVEKYTGLNANKKINSLSDDELARVANAIRKVEGWNIGHEQKL
jgi:hypothetical protein